MTEDVVLLAPNTTPLVGKAVVRPWHGMHGEAIAHHRTELRIEKLSAAKRKPQVKVITCQQIHPRSAQLEWYAGVGWNGGSGN